MVCNHFKPKTAPYILYSLRVFEQHMLPYVAAWETFLPLFYVLVSAFISRDTGLSPVFIRGPLTLTQLTRVHICNTSFLALAFTVRKGKNLSLVSQTQAHN